MQMNIGLQCVLGYALDLWVSAPVWPDGATKGGEQDRTSGAQSDAESQMDDLLF